MRWDMVRLYSFVFLFVLLFVAPLRGEWVSLKKSSAAPAPPSVTLVRDDLSSTILRIDVSGFDVQTVNSGDRTYTAIDLLTDASTTDPGFAEVPLVSKVLAVPDHGTISVEVIATGEEYTFKGYTLPPARRSWIEGEQEPPYVERQDAYTSADPYPSVGTVVDAPSVFRDFRIARVAAYPVRYIAATHEIKVASSITIKVTYGNGEGANPRMSARKPIAPSFAALYRSSIFNYQSVLDRYYGGLETGREVLVVIVPDAFYASILPWAEWRHKTGTFVKVVKFSDIGANATNPDLIKNYLAQIYHSWEFPPTYILLAGDYGYIPIKQITYDYTIVSEDYYVEIDGSDFFPEMMIGRFTHETEAAEQNIVSKIVGYEKTPYTANTAWYLKGIVAANDQYQSQVMTKRWARDRMMLDGKFSSVDTFMNHTPCYSALSDLINCVNNGRSFLNYRGEGWYTGWSSSCYHFQTTDVTSLNNGRMLTFVTSIGCGVAAFNQSSCFGEQWLELGTVAAPRGAVTFIGPTSNTHTTYNNKIDRGIYMGLFQEGMDTPGQGLARGRLYMYEVFGNERWVEYQTRIYCVLGDPSLHVWMNTPRPVTVTHAGTYPIGYNQVAFTVTDSATGTPVPHAEVCIAGDSVYTKGFTNAQGRITLPITVNAIDTLSVLVRGGVVIPYEGSIVVTSDAEHVAPFGEPPIVDLDGNLDGLINPNEHGEITFSLKNWGTQDAANVSATVSVDTNLVRMVTTSPVSFGTLAPGASAVGTPFQFFVKPECAVGDTIEFLLHIASSDQTWDYVQSDDVKGCKLDAQMFVVDDRNAARPNGRPDPGETVKLYLVLKNRGEDFAPNVRTTLRSNNPFVTVLDSTADFGSMPIDSTITNYNDFFVVKVDSTCPAHTAIPVYIGATTAGGSYPYSAVDTLPVNVSIPRRSDPTGPNSYGYYAYASDDTLFAQSPRYAWTELYGGLGTRITVGSSGNTTVTLSLPFTFKYYGRNYTQVRVSSDGWIAFGSGTQTNYTNYCMPHNDNVANMVAAFWLNLFATASETGQLLYYYDAARHTFTVEWYNVGHSADVTKKETFQIILYDPVRFPTPTGDGEILMQYKNTADPGDNTVGIEDSTQTIALQYQCGDQPDYDESITPLRDTLAILYTTRSPQLLVSVKDPTEESTLIPTGFVLEQNFPNPFNPTTRISYGVPVNSHVTLGIYSVTGQLVRRMYDGEAMAGRHAVVWDGRNDRGIPVSTGVYFYRMQATPRSGGGNGFLETRKLLLLK
jgi:hypothetical protein